MKEPKEMILADAIRLAIEANYTIIKQRKIIGAVALLNVALLCVIIILLV